MDWKNEKGMTALALMAIIIIMIIVIVIGIYVVKNVLNNTELENIVSDMISINTKAEIIAYEYNFQDIENLVGTPLDEDNSQDGIQLGKYVISEELRLFLEGTNEAEENIDISKLYVWTKDDLIDQGLDYIDVDDEKFYIVYYNLSDTSNCEVYYSRGFEGKYSMSDLYSLGSEKEGII